MTVGRSFILTGEWMQDRQLTYTEFSRARERTHIFTTRREAGRNLSRLAAAVARDHRKRLALEVQAELQRHAFLEMQL